MSRKKQWSASAKFEIALLAIKGETTLNEVCKRYQVAPSLVHTWKKQLLE
jgi:transposase